MLGSFRIFIVLLFLCTFVKADIFEQNSISLGAKYSSASYLDNDYDVAGLNINYFVLDGLGIGVEYENWIERDEAPRIEKIGVSTTYFVPVSEPIRPYIGAVYRRLFTDSVYDTSTYGYRAGISFSSDRASMSLGWSEERLSSCQDTQECTNGFAEVLISISFSI